MKLRSKAAVEVRVGEMSENLIGDLQEYEARKNEARQEYLASPLDYVVETVRCFLEDAEYRRDPYTPMIESILKQWDERKSISDKQHRALVEHLLSRESFA